MNDAEALTASNHSRRLARQRQRDTRVEVELRRRLHAAGLRYRVQMPLLVGTRRRVDIVFTRARVAVDVRGCFWHGCPEHGTTPRTRSDWWKQKIVTNLARDADTESRLLDDGWQVIIVWEHEDLELAAARVIDAVERAGQPS